MNTYPLWLWTIPALILVAVIGYAVWREVTRKPTPPEPKTAEAAVLSDMGLVPGQELWGLDKGHAPPGWPPRDTPFREEDHTGVETGADRAARLEISRRLGFMG